MTDSESIDKSWYRYNPRLTRVCMQVMERLNKETIPERKDGFNKCWFFMQLLYVLHRKKDIELPYYWYKTGVVVDPETLMLMTKGIIRFKWEPDCVGCQIEQECPCKGNPNNNGWAEFIEKAKTFWKE